MDVLAWGEMWESSKIMFHNSTYCLFLTLDIDADTPTADWCVTSERAWSLIYVDSMSGHPEGTRGGRGGGTEEEERGVQLHRAEKWPAHLPSQCSLRWPTPFVVFVHVCVCVWKRLSKWVSMCVMCSGFFHIVCWYFCRYEHIYCTHTHRGHVCMGK